MSEAQVPEIRSTTLGMKCPVCTVDLLMTDRNGIEVDYCPRCRGIWLDRGDLDTIIERSTGEQDRRPGPSTTQHSEPAADCSSGSHGERRGGHHGGGHGRRGRSWLRDLID